MESPRRVAGRNLSARPRQFRPSRSNGDERKTAALRGGQIAALTKEGPRFGAALFTFPWPKASDRRAGAQPLLDPAGRGDVLVHPQLPRFGAEGEADQLGQV